MSAERKRTRDDLESAENINTSGTTLLDANEGSIEAQNEEEAHGEWQTVGRRGKKRKINNTDNSYPAITHSPHARLQSFVKIGDLQNLVLYLLADGSSPQWCSVRHHNDISRVVVLMVPALQAEMLNGKISPQNSDELPKTSNGIVDQPSNGTTNEKSAGHHAVAETPITSKQHLTPEDYYPVKIVRGRLPEPLQPLADMFDYIWPIKTPGDDRHAKMHSPLAAMLVSPIVKTKEEKKAKGPQYPSAGRDWKGQRVSIVELIASTPELVEEGYVLHPAHYNGQTSAADEIASRKANHTSSEDGWVDLPRIDTLEAAAPKDASSTTTSLTGGRRVLAMDCEMCVTSPVGVSPQVLSLTRISIIDWDGKTVLDELVKPADPITDYLTPYSGITADMLKDVTTTLADIQAKLEVVLTPDTVLIGHSLNSDLNALKLTHPYIIDTALLYPHPRGRPLKSSLKWLAQKYLSREIQRGHGSTGHDSIEDARACLDLVKQKCEKGKAWGTSEANGESLFKRIGRAVRNGHSHDAKAEHLVTAIVDWGNPALGYGGAANFTFGAENDAAIVAGVHRAVGGDGNSSPQIPDGGCDFVWARLRELEAYRGWWTRSKSANGDNLRAATQDAASESSLAGAVQQTVSHIRAIYDSLPARTAFIVYSGSGEPRELQEMQALQKKFKEEYRVKKWDQLSVKWTDTEEQRLRRACEQARRGCGFMTVK